MPGPKYTEDEKKHGGMPGGGYRGYGSGQKNTYDPATGKAHEKSGEKSYTRTQDYSGKGGRKMGGKNYR